MACSPARFGSTRAVVAGALGAAILFAACGVKTDPRPPQDTAAVIPATPTVTATDAGPEIAWPRAARSADGRSLYDLAGFVVERIDRAGAVSTVTTVDVEDTDRIRKQKRFAVVDAAAPSSITHYRVRAFTADGQQGVVTDWVLAPAR